MTTENERCQSIIDCLNKLLIFQTNCDMNDKYDTNGFSDLINEIKIQPHIDEIVKECGKYGGSIEAFKTMSKLEFAPIDEFLNADEVYASNEKSVQKDVDFFIQEKCFSPEAVPLTESDQNAFNLLLKEKSGPLLFIESVITGDSQINSHQTFKNLALLLRLYLS